MGRVVEKLSTKNSSVMQHHTQAGNIIADLKVEVNVTPPEISATNVVTWKFHVDDSTKCIYDMILERYILIELSLNLKFCDHII